MLSDGECKVNQWVGRKGFHQDLFLNINKKNRRHPREGGAPDFIDLTEGLSSSWASSNRLGAPGVEALGVNGGFRSVASSDFTENLLLPLARRCTLQLERFSPTTFRPIKSGALPSQG
jgi:hypothetical protein